GEVLFNGTDAADNFGLWVTNGTVAGTFELTGINGASTDGLDPSNFTLFNGEVLFNGTDVAGNSGLWRTNGTVAATFELTGISGANTTIGLAPTDVTAPVTSVDDLTGFGLSDLLWQNGTTFTAWDSTGNGFTPNNFVGSVASGWTLTGTGDFTSNGLSDL